MSLAALLLGLPAKVFKLRGNNAPVLSVPITPKSITVAGTQNNYLVFNTFFSTSEEPDMWSHMVSHAGLNNAVPTDVEVCNLSGPGAFDGIWMSIQNQSTATMLHRYGLSVVRDGEEMIDQSWRMLTILMSGYSWALVGAIGKAFIERKYILGSGNYHIDPQWGRLSVPIPFKQSLVVTLKHYETDRTQQTKCWVNAWRTE